MARLDEPMFDLNKKVTAEMLREREIAIHGSKQFVIDKIMKMRKESGYDDFCFMGWFELGGFEAEEIEEQMQIFAEEVMPVIASANAAARWSCRRGAGFRHLTPAGDTDGPAHDHGREAKMASKQTEELEDILQG